MDNPKLRPVEAIPVHARGQQMVALRDPSGLTDRTIAISPATFFIVSMFDGKHSVVDIQAAYTRRFGDLLFSDKVNEIMQQLDQCHLLEGERFEAYKRSQEQAFARLDARAPTHAGSAYETDPSALRKQLDAFFTGKEAPGPIDPTKRGGTVKAIVAPHIDLRRGRASYAWAYKALAEECDADLFVVLGIVHHQTRNLFALTDKHFDTPLGRMQTDRDFVARLRDACRTDLFHDEFAHKAEHSVEFQAVMLRYVQTVRGDSADPDVAFVPVLCSSFLEAVKPGQSPMEEPRIREFVEALRRAMEACGRKVCVMASVDLSHVGQRFGDQVGMSPGVLGSLESHDRELLQRVEAADADAFFRQIADENDRHHVCGYPAICVLLGAAQPARGHLLQYEQSVERQANSVVTFAAMKFEEE